MTFPHLRGLRGLWGGSSLQLQQLAVVERLQGKCLRIRINEGVIELGT